MVVNYRKKRYISKLNGTLLLASIFTIIAGLGLLKNVNEVEKYLSKAPLIEVTEATRNIPYEQNLVIYGNVTSDSSVSDKPWTGEDELVYLIKIYTETRTENSGSESRMKTRTLDTKILKSSNIKLGSYNLSIGDFKTDSIPRYLVSDEYSIDIPDYLEKTGTYHYPRGITQQYRFKYRGIQKNQNIYVVGKLDRNNNIVPNELGTILTEKEYEDYISGSSSRMFKIPVAIALFFFILITTSTVQSMTYGKNLSISFLRFIFACSISFIAIKFL
ncbi:hypothetical protein [Wukongibacter baidiensis]